MGCLDEPLFRCCAHSEAPDSHAPGNRGRHQIVILRLVGHPSLDRLLVVLRTPDVKPHTVVVGHTHRLSGVEKGLDQIGEVEVPLARDVPQSLGLHGVDPHAHPRRDLRLLDEAPKTLVGAVRADVKDTVVDLDLPLLRRDGDEILVIVVVSQERAVVKPRQDVAVHDNKRRVQATDEAERRRRAERLRLAHVLDGGPVCPTRLELFPRSSATGSRRRA